MAELGVTGVASRQVTPSHARSRQVTPGHGRSLGDLPPLLCFCFPVWKPIGFALLWLWYPKRVRQRARWQAFRTAHSAQTDRSEDSVKKAVSPALNRVVGAPLVRVAIAPAGDNPATSAAAVGVIPPAGVVPKGVTLPDGSVFVFADSAESVADVDRVVFYELFHRGSKGLAHVEF